MDADENYSPSESEDEFNENDKILLKRSGFNSQNDSESEEEVYGLLSSSDESEDKDDMGEDIASDIEDNKDDELPDSRAWGHKRKHFYDTDLDPDYAGIQAKDPEAVELEEKEARNIQERLAEQLDAGTDFSLDILTAQIDPAALKEKTEGSQLPIKEEKIQTDLSKLTKRQKLDLLQKESPEFLGLVNDFKEKITEVINVWQPIKKLIDESKIKSPVIEHLVQTKHSLILNYCSNIGLYLLLKSLKLPVQSHPVIKRIFQIRQLISSLAEVRELIIDKFDSIMKMVDTEEEISIQEASEEDTKKLTTNGSKKRILKFLQQGPENKKSKSDSNDEESGMESTDDKKPPLKPILKAPNVFDLNGRGQKGKKKRVENGEDSDGSLGEENEDKMVGNNEMEEYDDFGEDGGKRAITYQMAKNKGLTPRRKKEQRNPRVKHRNKFKKAKIRRRGQVREVRLETNRYGGEISGIKASVSKSIKLK